MADNATGKLIYNLVKRDGSHVKIWSYPDKLFGFVIGDAEGGHYHELNEEEEENISWVIQAEIEARFNEATEDY